MKTHPEIEQLRALDPVPQAPHDPARADRLLHQILAEPRSEAPRRRWGLPPRVGGIALVAAAAVAAAVIVLSGGGVAPSLVDRAYAAINAGYVVVHEVDIQTYASPRGFSTRLEGWTLPPDGRTRAVQVAGYGGASNATIVEWIIAANGDVFTRACLAGCRSDRVSSFVDGRSQWASEGRQSVGTGFGLTPTLPGTFARQFKSAYRSHAISSDGTARFDGRRVARFESMAPSFGPRTVFWRPGTKPPASARNGAFGQEPYSLVDWYVDPATAQPVGFTASACRRNEISSCGRPVYTTRIVTFERLQPTAENLAKLTGPNAPAGAR
jgi:hypothetical protein